MLNSFPSLKRDKRGFTLIEVLIVVLVLGVIGTAAVSSYVRSTQTFTFLGKYKNVITGMRLARSYALTNRLNGGEVPPRYGVFIEEGRMRVFVDDAPLADGGQEFRFDRGGDAEDTVLPGRDYEFEDFVLAGYDSAAQELDLPITVFYELGTGEVNVYSDGFLVDKRGDKFITVEAQDTATEVVRYIVLFQVSGLPEEFDEFPQ